MNILVINCSDFSPNLASYYQYYGGYYPPPAIFKNPVKDYNCLHFIRYLRQAVNSAGYLLFSVSATEDITGLSANLYGYTVATLCLTTCPANYYVDYSLNKSQCLLCDYAIVNCLNCTSKSVCTLCKPIATLSNQRCTICAIFM